MSEIPNGPGFWLERLLGTGAGSLVSLAYLMPKGRQEAFSRLAVSLASGMVFGGQTGLLMADRLGLGDHLSASELMLSGSAAASLSAWWVLGILARIAAHSTGRDDSGGQ